MPEPARRRFRVALSFPGEHRHRVECIANLLSQSLTRDEILYDRWHAVEFSRPNLDVYLPKLYHDQSDLIVVFICEAYERKEWCGLESRAWRDILKQKQDDRLMFIRLDEGQVPGTFSIDGYLEISHLPDAEVAAAILTRVSQASTSSGITNSLRTSLRTSIQHLPAVNPTLFGRTAEIARIERAWSTPGTNLLQIIAPGGTGKSTLVTNWYRRHLSHASIFGWSFYSQGTREKSETSSEPFFNELLSWFDITVQPTDSLFRKVDLIVDRFRRQRVLLILDGLEPLQHPTGDLRDPALKAILQELNARNAGLVLVTTRVRLTDITDDNPLSLDNLSSADGADYLKSLGVQGSDDELRAASEAYDNHALALTLLGTYLKTFCQSDVRRRTDIKDMGTDLTAPGRHVRKMMASYARMYEGRAELDVLRALGHFDRPAEPEAVKLVLSNMSSMTYQAALATLHNARLILTAEPAKPIDCHPLIREHFASEATNEGHSTLYAHYTKQAKKYPDTLKEMEPLFQAVYHGCRSGRHAECLDEVYRERIARDDEFYLVRKLGASATDLSLLANFFDTPWRHPVACLPAPAQAWTFSRAGFALRAVGRLLDAVELLRASADASIQLEHWEKVANAYSNLSQLQLTLGNLEEAISVARDSVTYADLSGNAFERILSYAALADALHESGDRAKALDLFRDAERIQAEREPHYPLLYSLQGYGYCRALLLQGERAQVIERTAQTLLWVKELKWLLSIGHDHLLLGRSYADGSSESIFHLDEAVHYIRGSGFVEFLPRALLARARSDDIEEAYRIASRCGMGLYLGDPRLTRFKRVASN